MSNHNDTLETILRLAATDIAKCIQCGKCSAACSAAMAMDILPNRVVWELKNGRVDDLLKCNSPWQCQSCLACEERCPRGVSPARLMEALRLVQVREQGGNKIAIEDLENYEAQMPQQLLVAALRKYNK